jgi:hypothetical protein
MHEGFIFISIIMGKMREGKGGGGRRGGGKRGVGKRRKKGGKGKRE